MAYNPEIYLESALRELEKYAKDRFHHSVLDENLEPVGEFVYEVIMQFPGDVLNDLQKVPLAKTIIHFELDDSENMPVGFGDNIFQSNYDALTERLSPQEASKHLLNFDVGIWASDVSGGTTARLRAQQILNFMFVGFLAQQALTASSDGGDGGLEILRYAGGQFLTERVNDINTYRMIGAELELRVFSRTPVSVTVPSIEGFEIEEIVIQEEVG